jgi:hypothetical protein
VKRQFLLTLQEDDKEKGENYDHPYKNAMGIIGNYFKYRGLK